MRAQIYMQLIALCMLLACSCYGDEVCHSESSLNCLPLTCSGSTFCCHIETAQVDDDTCFNSCCSLDSTTTTALRTTTTTTTSRRSGSEYDDESLQSVHFRRVVLGGLILFCCVPGLVIVAWFLRFITAFCQGRAIRSDLERLRQQEATATPELVVVSEIELEKASLPKLQACVEDGDSNSMHTERMLAAVKHLNAQPKGCSVADCTYCQTDLQCPICLSSTIDSKPTFTPCFHVFCRDCILRASTVWNHLCPTCKSPVTTLFEVELDTQSSQAETCTMASYLADVPVVLLQGRTHRAPSPTSSVSGLTAVQSV